MVFCETVEHHEHTLSHHLQVPDVPVEVFQSGFHAFRVIVLHLFLWHSSMEFQSPGGGHEYGEFRVNTHLPAFDVDELLRSEVGSESRFRHGILTGAESEFCGHDGVASMCDVGEWSAMDDSRSVFSGLNEVGLEGILEQCDDASGDAQFLQCEFRTVHPVAEQDVVDSPSEVLDVGGEAEDGHDFRGWGDVESRFADDAVGCRTESGDDVPEISVVDVHHPFPEHLFERRNGFLMLVEIIVHQGCDHVVRCGHSMEVAGEMQVDLVHRQHLRIAASACAPFHSKTWSE